MKPIQEKTPELDRVEKLLARFTEEANDNELLVTCLPSVRNMAQAHVQLGFSGWNIKLYGNGTWTLQDTGGCLKHKDTL